MNPFVTPAVLPSESKLRRWELLYQCGGGLFLGVRSASVSGKGSYHTFVQGKVTVSG